MEINKLIELIEETIAEENSWKDYFGNTISIGDVVIIWEHDKYKVYFYRAEVLGGCTTPARKEKGYIRIKLIDPYISKHETVCLPKNVLKYY